MAHRLHRLDPDKVDRAAQELEQHILDESQILADANALALALRPPGHLAMAMLNAFARLGLWSAYMALLYDVLMLLWTDTIIEDLMRTQKQRVVTLSMVLRRMGYFPLDPSAYGQIHGDMFGEQDPYDLDGLD